MVEVVSLVLITCLGLIQLQQYGNLKEKKMPILLRLFEFEYKLITFLFYFISR